ncbi:MAG TPA: CAP domain-containing protein [Candidatus Nitrosotalea sp.]|nr:CAP domain-containing protein [Candidatus Nitrosotalea sp.]
MSTCLICHRTNVDTISGVCGECIGRNRVRRRNQKNRIKISIIVAAIAIASFFAYQNIGTIKNNAVNTEQIIVKQIPNITKQISTPIQSVAPQIINTVSNAPKSIPQVNKPTIIISDLELKVHNGINAQRQSHGLTPLVYDDKIATIAREHSQDMITRNYFAHDTPDGISPSQRGIDAGYHDCGDRQAIRDSQEYDRLTKQFEATGNTDQVLYGQIQALYTKVTSETSNGMIFLGFPENIEQNNLYDSVEYIDGIPIYHWLSEDQLSSSIVDVWMNSPGHRENILTPAYYSQGIGIAISSDDKVFITEDFC